MTTEHTPAMSAEIQPSASWSDVEAMVGKFHIPNDPLARAEDFASMETDDLIAMTTLLHNVLAPSTDMNPTDTRMKVQSPDGARSTELMEPKDRYNLFSHATDLLAKLGNGIEGQSQAEDFLRRAGNVVALTVAITHPFEDGNGRTARFMAHLVREGGGSSGELSEAHKLAGSNRPSFGFKINSFVPRMADMNPEQYLETVAALDIPLGDKDGQYKQRMYMLTTSPYTD